MTNLLLNDLRANYLARAVAASEAQFDATGFVVAADDVAAAALLARDLTRGDDATFKAGYTVENAALAAADVFGVTAAAVLAELGVT